MSATFGAALKKIAMAVLSDSRKLKKIGIGALSIFVGLLMPLAAVIGVFSGKIEITEEDIDRAMSDEEQEKYRRMDEVYNEINTKMTSAGFAPRIDEARVLYVMSLTDYMYDDTLPDRLVGCFAVGQTDEELVTRVNSEFGTQIQLEDYLKVIEDLRKMTINPYIFTDTNTKNNVDLVAFAQEACDDEWGYVWATYGLILTEESLDGLQEQFPEEVGGELDFIRENWLGRRTVDCAGLIKSYLWYDYEMGEILYERFGIDDMRADELFEMTEDKGTLDTMPEVVGLGVWHEGHVGIYVGDGYVIHANGTHRGVEKQLLTSTKFTHWFTVPWIAYLEPVYPKDSSESPETAETTITETDQSETADTSETVPSEST